MGNFFFFFNWKKIPLLIKESKLSSSDISDDMQAEVF